MPSGLNIPLSRSTPTRRFPRRVVPLIVGPLILALFLAGSWRLWVTRDTTTSFGPAAATEAVRLFKTPNNVEILSEKLRGKQLLFGFPLRPEDLLSLAHREITIWISADGMIRGITLDGAIPTETQTLLQGYGFFVDTHEKVSFIGLAPGQKREETHNFWHAWHHVFPWNDGEVIDLASGEATMFRMNSQAITLAAGQTSPDIADIYGFSHEVVTHGDAVVSGETDALASLGSSSEITSAIKNGVRILTGTDNQGTVTALILPTGVLTDAGAEMLAATMLAKSSLATQELTFKDGTSAAEIRSDVSKLTKGNDSDGTITWKNVKGDIIYYIKDQENDLIALSNRKLIPIDRALSTLSSCFPNGSSFTKTYLLQENGTVLQWFDQVAWNNKKTKFCW